MNVIDAPQGSPEWHAARCGSLGASAVHEALAKTKTGWGASRANCMARLIVERLTGKPQDTYQNAAMLHGIETEPEAIAAYSFKYDCEVEQVGLVLHPKLKGTHASPDGLVGDDGLVEFKCPQPATHLETLLGEPVADKYIKQADWQMACTDRAWVDWVSYCQAFPEEMRFFRKRIARDQKRIAELELEVDRFLDAVEEKLSTLRSRYASLKDGLRGSIISHDAMMNQLKEPPAWQ